MCFWGVPFLASTNGNRRCGISSSSVLSIIERTFCTWSQLDFPYFQVVQTIPVFIGNTTPKFPSAHFTQTAPSTPTLLKSPCMHYVECLKRIPQ